MKLWLCVVSLLGLLMAAPAAAAAAPGPQPVGAVDVALVLAIDASGSITGGDLEFELQGHAQAFRSAALAEAITSGPHHAIAVALVTWSGPGTAAVLVPWTRIASAAEAGSFADRLDRVARPGQAGSTAIGSALDAIRPLFDRPGLAGARKVIDLVSNGFSNSGAEVEAARDRTVAAGITINALALLDDYDWLESYYRESVIGGPGAFVRAVATRDAFVGGLMAKLVAEIV